MKSISLTVDPDDYERFRRVAAARQQPIAQIIREAMSAYLEQVDQQEPLRDLAVLAGHQPSGPLPSRAQLYDEVFASKASD
jgi:hypothetical protein